ncbi:unnamed protein product [Somion occarium]|uniref:Uncharacterized protein n=1 Tax=Somion occarium TaxID=3059160 RepID=A0ABP1DK79_9APHY
MSHKIRLHGDLTTTRIIRLLRPLRTKCESLSASPSKPGVSVTYASSSRRPMESSSDVSTSRHAFSLTALPPPERMHSLKYDRELLQLSRKIYDIKDAFHNVIQSALGTSFLLRRQSQPSHADETESRVLGLAAMCSTIVGEHIEAEVKASQETMNTVSAFEDGDISVITELYDAIPAHHRRHAIISHALSVILTTCPHYPTLLSILLELTVAYTLAHESERLLETIFVTVFRSNSAFMVSSISDISQSRYLTSLHEKCCKFTSVNSRVFTRILSGVLADSYGSKRSYPWICPAMSRLMHVVRTQDDPSLMNLCIGIAECVSTQPEKGKEVETNVGPLWTMLAENLQVIFTRLHSRSSTAKENDILEGLQAISEFLEQAFVFGLHRHDSPDSSDVRNTLSSLALYCLTSLYLPSLGIDAEHKFIKMLTEMQLNNDSYLKFISVIYPSNAEDLMLPPSIDELATYPKALRIRSLFAQEAPFWSSVLRHVEALAFNCPGSSPHPHRAFLLSLRAELVARVEEVEHLQFKANLATTTYSGKNSALSGAEVEADWRWEDLVGCWVRKTPIVPKRRKRLRPNGESPAHIRRLQLKRSSLEEWAPSCTQGWDVFNDAGKIQNLKRRRTDSIARQSEKSSSASSSMSTSSHGTLFSTGQSTVVPPSNTSRRKRARSPDTPPSSPAPSIDLEDIPPRSKLTASKPRRISNFSSILADAQMNRVVLHDSDSEDDNLGLLKSPPAPSLAERLVLNDLEEEDVLQGVCTAEQLSSDDLNLFAYPSSPIKY